MAQRPSIDALMHDVGVTIFPERWRTFYDDVMADYEKNGCTAPSRGTTLTARQSTAHADIIFKEVP